VLAVALDVAVPLTITGDGELTTQNEQALAAARSQFEMAKQAERNPEVIQQLVPQAETGRNRFFQPKATRSRKLEAARGFIDRQLQQMEQQTPTGGTGPAHCREPSVSTEQGSRESP